MWEFLSRLDFYAKLAFISGLIYTGGGLLLIIYQLLNFKKLGEIRAASLIALLSLLQTWSMHLSPLFESHLIQYAIRVSASIYIVVESILLQYVFYNIIASRRTRTALKFLIAFSIFFLAIEAINDFKDINEKYREITLVTTAIMLFLCFIGYYQIINITSERILTASYVFWFITAVFFFFSISLPLYFFRGMLYKQNVNNSKYFLLVFFGYIYYFGFFLLLYFSSRCKARAQK